MIKKWIFIVAYALPFCANASCIGSSTMYTCNEQDGSSYRVNKIGGTTYLNGSNSQTGSNWTQTSRSIGNTTYQSGTDSDGNMWNQTIRSNGGNVTYQGQDSNGNFYTKTCNQFGCF